MRATPRLTIGLPVYNGEGYLTEAIESLLAQTFTDFRLIISDNASSDGTEAICRAYAARDARIAYHRAAANRGLSWNFNRVVALADGEYFKWAAHDDRCAPTFVERCIDVLDAEPSAVLAFTAASVIDERGAVLGQQCDTDAIDPRPSARFARLLWDFGYCLMLFGVTRLEVLRRTQPLGAYPASDLPLLAELALRGSLHRLDEPLFFSREHAQRPVRVCTTDSELATWMAPENAGRAQFRHLTLFARYVRTVGRVPLAPAERLRCAATMVKWLTLKAPQIQDEVRGNIARPLRRAVRRWMRAAAAARPAR